MKRRRVGGEFGDGRESHGLLSPSATTTTTTTVVEAYINDDLVEKILLRLPVKSVVRFRSVCKNWLSLASDRSFLAAHTRMNPSPAVAGFVMRKNGQGRRAFESCSLDGRPTAGLLPDPTLSFPAAHTGIMIVNSCNGLMLGRWRSESCLRHTYYVFNPTTMEYKAIPNPDEMHTFFGICLAFNPSNSPHYRVVYVGWTKSSIRENYMEQLIEAWISPSDHPVQVAVYYSETGLWKPYTSSTGELNWNLYTNHSNSVFWNGALHWIALRGYVASFDIEREHEWTTPLPPIPQRAQRCVLYFGESHGHLHLIESYNVSCLDVMEMARDYSGWSSICRVDLVKIRNVYPHIQLYNLYCCGDFVDMWDIRPIYVVQGEEVEENDILVLHAPGKILSYNLMNHDLGNICDTPLSCFNSFDYIVHTPVDIPYAHTLSPL